MQNVLRLFYCVFSKVLFEMPSGQWQCLLSCGEGSWMLWGTGREPTSARFISSMEGRESLVS